MSTFVTSEQTETQYKCTVYDQCEGTLHLTVHALTEDEAYSEAGIAASEQGCNHINEIVVGVWE